IEPGSAVYIVDFSFPLSVLEKMKESHNALTVIDHHKTALGELSGFSRAFFDLDESGATLTWKHLFPDEPIPEFLQYVRDHDLWKYQKPFSRQVKSAMRSRMDLDDDIETLFASCDEIAEQFSVDEFAKVGQPSFAKRMAEVRAKAAGHAWAVIGGYRVPVAEAYRYYSEVAHLLCEMYLERPFAACYRSQAGIRVWDLRSVGEFDVSEIAQEYGGGGHLNASGFADPDRKIEIFYE
ncbi:MAG: hypothetical protein AAF986_07370, partial [Pseudomonadota bacterium]